MRTKLPEINLGTAETAPTRPKAQDIAPKPKFRHAPGWVLVGCMGVRRARAVTNKRFANPPGRKPKR